MKKYQMLEKAMKDYPKGTKFISLFGNEIESSGLFFIDGTDSVAESPSNCNVHQSETGKRAEIVNPKIAVKVENEKERDLLEQHFKSLGWNFGVRRFPLVKYYDNTANGYSGNPINLSVNNAEEAGYKVLSFSDFAKAHNIKLPMIKSEDGVWLYEGDEYYRAEIFHGKWALSNYTKDHIIDDLKLSHAVIHSPEISKDFTTKQAALDWIEAQKPKEIKVKLFGNKKAFICKDKITIDDGKYTFDLFPSDLEDINHYFKELS